MYDESMKMPLIVKWPGVTKPGSINRDLVQNLDYAETFLEMAGAGIPKDMQGRSLVPLLRGKTPADWRSELYYHYYGFPAVHMVAKHYGIRGQRYKLIRFYQMDEWEFYDLKTDPDELRNQYNNPEYSKIIAQQKKRLTSLRKKYQDNSDVKVMPPAWQNRYRKTNQPDSGKLKTSHETFCLFHIRHELSTALLSPDGPAARFPAGVAENRGREKKAH